MATTEFDRESTATSRRVEKRDFSNSFDDAERYRGDRVSNDAFVKKLIEQRKEREEKWFAFEQQMVRHSTEYTSRPGTRKVETRS